MGLKWSDCHYIVIDILSIDSNIINCCLTCKIFVCATPYFFRHHGYQWLITLNTRLMSHHTMTLCRKYIQLAGKWPEPFRTGQKSVTRLKNKYCLLNISRRRSMTKVTRHFTRRLGLLQNQKQYSFFANIDNKYSDCFYSKWEWITAWSISSVVFTEQMKFRNSGKSIYDKCYHIIYYVNNCFKLFSVSLYCGILFISRYCL